MEIVHDAGLELVREIRKRMQIDDTWSCSEPDGFRWWGDNLMQRVWAEPARDSLGMKVQCIHASTTQHLCAGGVGEEVPRSSKSPAFPSSIVNEGKC